MDKLKWIALGLALIMPPGLSSESADVEAAEHASFVQAMMGQLHSLMERDYRVKFGDLRKEDPEIGQPDIRRRLQDYTREMKEAEGPSAQNVYSRWEQGTLALTGEAGEAFFSALNAPAQLMPGGFRQPSPVKIVEFGPLRILCDTYPKTVCTFSWSPSPAERIAAASGDIGRGPCLKDFAVREGRVSVACGPQELVLARETAR